MTPDFIEWIANQWPIGSESNHPQWKHLCEASKIQLNDEQILIWFTTLVNLVTERWADIEPNGLATARAAAAFFQIEASEHESWWDQPPIEIENLENYLCTALDGIFYYDENLGIEESLQIYPNDDDHDCDSDCKICQPRWAFQDARGVELKNTVISMVAHAHARAVALPAETKVQP